MTAISLPKSIDEALAAATELRGEYRSGGTDVQDRRRHQLPSARAAVVDLRDVPELSTITCDQQGARIGARATLASIAAHPVLAERWPGIGQAFGALATPQIRAVASLAGSLLQGPRCWYYRHPDYPCLRKGGATCYAREGDHLWHVCFDRSPCAAPHPSTTALALLAYEAQIELLGPGDASSRRVPVQEVLDVDALAPGTLITAAWLGPPLARERSAYVRASNRAFAEWALVEASVRLVLSDDGTIAFCRVAVGAVAPTPLRLEHVEAALLGKPATPEHLSAAAGLATRDAKPLRDTGYKLALLEGALLEALEQALAHATTPAAIEIDP
jgi:xanthine dehydrogenase YagS FAD-binding subunit